MTRDVYASVREHLQVAVSWRKRYYDIRVKDCDFQPGIVGLVLLPIPTFMEVPQVAKGLHWTIPNCLRVDTFERRVAKIQEEFTIHCTLRQIEGFLRYATDRLAVYNDVNHRRTVPTP